MTDSETAQGAMPPEPLASERLDMLGQLVVAQFDLEKALAELARNGADTSTMQTQLQNLTQLQRQVGTATGATLAMLRGDISAAIAQSQNATQDARAAGVAGAVAVSLASLAIASREQVTSLMRDLHQFDGELEFGAAAEQSAYRQREAERRADIGREHGKHTPEGDLNAAGIAVGQMADAHAHGADSPAFQKQWDELAETTTRLRDAARANGLSTDEFDRRLRAELGTVLKSQGHSDARVAEMLAASPDPLVVAKAYIGDAAGIDRIRRSAERVGEIYVPATAVTEDIQGLIASLQASGVVSMPHDGQAPPAHGVATAASAKETRHL